MKDNLHPQYFTNAKVVCACGNSFITGSTKQELRVEICYNCHPFYTGKQHLLDTAGTIDKFKKRSSKAAELKSKRIAKKLHPA
ncbi:MAG: 50S ribosomal protein L31 [Candidatus Doudnabacteria bacterium RIFCSPLOWO2_01_FULL_44_21]|uniref:Large ribosomal subunit protein bL31 n=1 Tax=Candidatus Doudnabacteria bacterium RIFCSPLOWO2_01_FULL_44_21 TaxID=1817841 RepID=A0A1F5PYD2_9BACT|nr:MAG: 50S ribosomal protein L31 [Candidatus Doudnabacteria bacterium RIFCSPHIGHO2_02_FULL_43_13b]OGE94722.1 MAG: 50S ribosomal protein L31 [Candidatus Doudnabacteria bacterium RIFCSPLOWO2_01_FULL_44_21]